MNTKKRFECEILLSSSTHLSYMCMLLPGPHGRDMPNTEPVWFHLFSSWTEVLGIDLVSLLIIDFFFLSNN